MSMFEHATLVAKSLHARLSSDIVVQNLLGSPPRLYDHAPEDPLFPYLSYGPCQSEDQSGDDCALYQHTMSLHLWSRYSGRSDILACIAAVGQAIESEKLTLISGQCISSRIVFTDYFRAPDGRTLHGVVRLIVVTQP